jgi:DNA-binding MarR family transcriptional regulator
MATFMKYIDLVSRSASIYRDDTLVECGISGCQSKYILQVCKFPGQTQEEMAKVLFVNKSNVARQVAALVKEGFIERRQSKEDKRVFLLYPTEKALGCIDAVKAAHARWRELVTEGMSEEEKTQLSALMEKLVENAERYMENRE